MPTTLTDWLTYLETLHPKTIALGLERVAQVKQRLNLLPEFPIIVVGGTNGKGSVCAMLESMLYAAGYRVGCYTSPHLLDYNERVRIGKRQVSDAQLCASFDKIEQARGDIPLTYFEFGTLAAMQCFIEQKIEVAILEVGLGGRLDAVNVFDADCAVVVSVDMDHMEYLGDTREKIAYEKAGIFRAGRVAIFGDLDMPAVIVSEAQRVGAPLWRLGGEFNFEEDSLSVVGGESAGHGARIIPVVQHSSPLRAKVRQQNLAGQWNYRSRLGARNALPYPALRGAFQLRNASTVLAVLDALKEELPVEMAAVRRGLSEVTLPGRFQVVPGRPVLILDVAHNPHAAGALAQNLANMPPSHKTFALFAMLKDKDRAGVVRALKDQVDTWLVAGIAAPRGATATEMAQVLEAEGVNGVVQTFATVSDALRHACNEAGENDRIVAFGSFYTVAEVMRTRGLRYF